MTETVLLDVLDGVYTATDDRQLSVLISLDLSAAFDTVDNSLLIECLTSEFRDTDALLDLLRSYLGDREQFIKMGCISQTQSSLMLAFHSGRYLAHCCSWYTAVQRLMSSHGMASSTSSMPTTCSSASVDASRHHHRGAHRSRRVYY